jgi:hypothetical protein
MDHGIEHRSFGPSCRCFFPAKTLLCEQWTENGIFLYRKYWNLVVNLEEGAQEEED